MGDPVLYCLAVDDEPLALKVLENYISVSAGVKLVAKCETIEDAFKAISTEHIDTIFLDLNLQDSFGLELVDKMQVDNDGRYYIIITSAMPRKIEEFSASFKSNRVILVDYLAKPFSYDRFLSVIQKTLDQKRRHQGSSG